jgi:hypothetical protein
VREPQATLFERAAALVARSGPAAALTIVPLAAATPTQATYLHAWIYAQATFEGSTNGGTRTSSLMLSSHPHGEKATGVATYTLNNSAIASIRAGYSGLGAGQVTAGQQADFAWNFSITDIGQAAIDSIEWQFIGHYDSLSGPWTRQTLASGTGFGAFSGAAPLIFQSSMNDMNWFGADLLIAATVAGTEPGLYQFEVLLSGDGMSYAFVPDPSSAGVLVLSALLMLRRRARCG